jgi:hypothetical protein
MGEAAWHLQPGEQMIADNNNFGTRPRAQWPNDFACIAWWSPYTARHLHVLRMKPLTPANSSERSTAPATHARTHTPLLSLM